ncbi:MAG: hypothetical protein RLQ25_08235 [Alphaproteobacteria bacterium]
MTFFRLWRLGELRMPGQNPVAVTDAATPQEALRALSLKVDVELTLNDRASAVIYVMDTLENSDDMGVYAVHPMAIWRLTPQEVDSPHWRTSTHKGPVVVRARSELDARFVATHAFVIAVPHVPGGDTPEMTWPSARYARCCKLEDALWLTDGPTAVLDPEVEPDIAGELARAFP